MYTPPFTITDEVLQLVSEICLHVGRIEAISQSRLPSPMLRKANRIRTIHSSLAIEHNSLTLQQVTDIVNGKRVLGAPDEILEVKNAIDAYRLLQQLDAFSQEDLLKTHTAMMHDLVHTAGHFRNEGVGVFDKDGSCVHMAPAAERVPWLMKDLFEWVSSTTIHPLISSCVFHYEFEFIHPFIDGNGRLGRFWQTLLLSRWKPVFAWLPVESIVHDNQEGYYAAIADSGSRADSTPFVTFMLRCLLRTVTEHEGTHIEETDAETPPLSKSEKIVLDAFRKNGLLTIAEVSELTGLSVSGVKKVITSLKTAGLLVRRGSNKNGLWLVSPVAAAPEK